MAKVLCTMKGCKYCGRKARGFSFANGLTYYTCKKGYIAIKKVYDYDGEITDMAGIMPICNDFKEKDN